MRAMKMTADARSTLDRLPRFGSFEASTITAALQALIDDQRRRIDALTADPSRATFENVVEPMQGMADELQRLYSPLSHLHGVADSEALREPYDACVALMSAFASELGQHAGLHACFRTIRDAPGFDALDEARRALVEHALRDFHLGGVDLPPEQQAAVRTCNTELARLATRFEQNLLDSTEAWGLAVDDEAALAGLPESVRALARYNAERAGEPGWRLSLDLPCYLPCMMHLESRELRRTLYEAYVTRASERGPHDPRHDNSAVMHDILAHRRRLAGLLGFGSYAELSLATKMAPSTEAVIDFLHELADKARPAAERELAELGIFARETLDLDPLEAWDQAWAAEKYREHCFEFRREDLKPYFPVARVVPGLFAVAERLFAVQFETLTGVETWHEDVTVHAVVGADGEPLGFFYLDLYARPGKRSGAWMDECLVRWVHPGGTQLPVAYLTCNFTPPVAGQPTLLTHDEVNTLFHEFGHGLHHLLTRVDVRGVAGINGVPWDAVELPSQMLENWCWEREALDLFAAHHDSGAPIPDDLYQRLRASQRFQAAMQMLRQIEFALFDFRLHLEYRPGLDIQGLLDQVRARVAVVRPPEFNRFQNGFAHIFAGGYAAGYYSYKWAEVLAADAFARFEDEGIFNRDTGLAFRETILAHGGAADAMALFRRFRGREPRVDALLRQAGLAA